jgi:hypothetical protein
VGIGTTAPSEQLDITGNFKMTDTTHASATGIIYKGSNPFLHNFNYGSNGTVTTEGNNTFLGINAGNLTMGSGATTTVQSSYNTGVGTGSLQGLTTGYNNSAFGFDSLRNNTAGANNSAFGMYSLRNNTGNNNSALGYGALYSNIGSNNSAFGYGSLFYSTSGTSNTALGYRAGQFISGGVTANVTSGTSLYLGASTKALASGDANEIVIGDTATGIGSNTVTLGNDSITTTALKGNVGIGTTAPGAKLEVYGDAPTFKIQEDSNPGYYFKIAVNYNSGDKVDFSFGTDKFLQYGNSGGSNSLAFYTGSAATEKMRIDTAGNVGIGTTAPGGRLDVVESGVKTADDYGIHLANTATSATPAINKYGLYLSSTGAWSGTNYGFYVDTPTDGVTANYAAVFAGGNVGIGTTAPDSALDVVGTIQASNLLGGASNITTDANGNIIREPSDQRLKENIQTIAGALGKVMSLRGVSYEWKDKEKMGEQTDYGLIAQEVSNAVPELATESSKGIMGVKYTNAVGLLVNAIKEQQGQLGNMGASFSTKNLTADSIKANRIEGLEFIQKDIADGKENLKNIAEAIKSLEDRVALLENSPILNGPTVAGVSSEKSLITMSLDMAVLKNMSVNGSIIVDGSAIFKSDVEFRGHVAFNTSAAGLAKIKKGDKKVEVVFDKPFADTPVIVVNAESGGVSFALAEKSKTGFTIKIKNEAEESLIFNWTATYVKGVKTYESDGDVSAQPASPTGGPAISTPVSEPIVPTVPVSEPAPATPATPASELVVPATDTTPISEPTIPVSEPTIPMSEPATP